MSVNVVQCPAWLKPNSNFLTTALSGSREHQGLGANLTKVCTNTNDLISGCITTKNCHNQTLLQ